MTNRQIAKIGMFRIIIEFCLKFLGVIKTVPAFYNAFEAFRATVAAIDTIAPRAAKKTTGPAVTKQQQRKNLETQAFSISRLLRAFAVVKKNAELKKAMHYTLSELQGMSYEELLPVCRLIHKTAVDNLSEMADFRVTQTMISSFQIAIDSLDDSIPKPRLELNERKGAGQQVIALYKEANQLLTDLLDPIALAFIETDPEFYNGYINNRQFIEPPVRHTQAVGVVTDKITGQPLPGVIAQQQKLELKATTGSEGDFVLMIPVSGTYTIIFTLEGYKPAKAEVIIKRGHITTINIELEPIV